MWLLISNVYNFLTPPFKVFEFNFRFTNFTIGVRSQVYLRESDPQDLNLMETDIVPVRFDQYLDQLLTFRDELVDKILENNKHWFTKSGLEIIKCHKSLFNRGLRRCNKFMSHILELLKEELDYQNQTSASGNPQTEELIKGYRRSTYEKGDIICKRIKE